MRSKRIILFCGIVLVLIALAFVIWRKNSNQWVVALPQFKSEKERLSLERQALEGSPEAADNIVGKLCLFPNSSAFYWANIAAENNSHNGAANMASLVDDPGMNGTDVYGAYRTDRRYFWTVKASKDKEHLERERRYVEKEFPDPQKMQPPPEEIVKRWELSEKTLKKFKLAAMRGSPEAAFRLYEYFSSPDSELKDGLFWAIIAAQNGHQGAPDVLGKLMLKSSNLQDRERAQFWLRKASTIGVAK
jgi:TPR repeat protein